MADPWLDDSLWLDSDDDAEATSNRASSVATTCTLFASNIDEDNDDDVEIINEEDGDVQILFSTEVIDLTGDDSEERTQHRRPDETGLDSVTAPCGTIVKPENFIEVYNTQMGDLKINFVKVAAIVRDTDGQTLIRGVPYTRLQNLKGKIRDRQNEVCMILHINQDPSQQDNLPILIDVLPDNVVRWRTLVTSNAAFPTHAVDRSRYARGSLTRKQHNRRIERRGNIVCRWKLTMTYSIQGNRRKAVQESIEHLLSADVADDKYRASDERVFAAWRGERKRGGAWNMQPHLRKPLNLPVSRHPEQAYTLFDSFCGAGGVSRGAQDAGFKVRHAIDKEPEV